MKLLATQMESAYLSIFVDAASQLANLAESKLFLVFESASGKRRIGGDDDLLAEFKAGRLWPKTTDELLKTKCQDVLPRNFNSGTLHQQDSHEQEEASNFNESQYDSFEEAPFSPSSPSSFEEAPSLVGKKRKNQDAEMVDSKRVKKVGGDQSESNRIQLSGDENEVKCAKNQENCPKPLKITFEQIDDDFDDSVLSHGVDDDEVDDDDEVYDDEVSDLRLAVKVEENEYKVAKTIMNKKGTFQQERKRCKLCPESKMTTYTMDAYRRHKKSVHDKNIVCLKCNKGFSCGSSLKRHYAQTGHTPKEWFENTSNESNPSD